MKTPVLSAALALSAAALGAAQDTPSARRPNVVILLADDLGYGELGCQGNAEIPTPHIDSLAKNGLRFTQGYVSGPYCSPTRAGLLTGRYQTRYGHEFNGHGPTFGLPLSEKTMADRLQSLGYSTCAIGKWHLGAEPDCRPMKRGFDEFYGTLGNTPFFHPRLVDSRISADPRRVEDDSFYTTDAYAERAVDWIGRHADKPFFLYLPFNAQHSPLQAPPKYLDRFRKIGDEKRRTFAAMLSAMDDAVDRVLAKIREIGQEENTLIAFLGDNGGPTSVTTSKNDPLRGFKASTSEGGIRVPFLIQWKGRIPAGNTYDHPVIQTDLLPTAIAAAGGRVDPAWKLDGVNLLPYLTGESPGKPHETLYWRFGEQWAVRHGDWKLVASHADRNAVRLIHLAGDIGEAKDLSSEKPEKVRELRAMWDRWSAEQVKPLWEPAEKKKR